MKLTMATPPQNVAPRAKPVVFCVGGSDYRNTNEKYNCHRNPSLKREPKPLGLASLQTGLPKILESGFIEIHMDHVPYRRIVFPKSLFSIWVNQRLPL